MFDFVIKYLYNNDKYYKTKNYMVIYEREAFL